MSGTVKQFVDFSSNTNNDTGENNAASIVPILDGEGITGATLGRPSESLRQRTEAIRNVMSDTLYLRDADRGLVVTGPAGATVTWPGSTTASQTGIPVLSDALWLLPLLTPGAAGNTPPVASTFGALHLKRASDSANAISVTSARRSYAAGDQINVTVTAGAVFSCVLDVETGFRRTIKVVATGSTTLGTVISALNGLTPPAPDNTQLVVAALEGGALSGDLILTTQARQYVVGNYDGEAHQVSAGTLASFFASNPTQALAEGDSLCIRYDMVADTASTGGRRQSIPENANTAVPAGSFFNSRVHPEFLTNALPVCKVVGGALVFPGGRTIPAGAVNVTLAGNTAMDFAYDGGVAWADGTTNPATSVGTQLDKILSDLAGAAGTAKIQGAAVGVDLSAATLAAQISALVTGWLKMSRDNSIAGLQTFEKLLTASAGLAVGGSLTTFTGFTFTANATTDLLTAASHPTKTGDGPINVSNVGGSLPGGLAAATNYWTIFDTTNTLKLARSFAEAMAGVAIDITSAGSGTHTLSATGSTAREADANVAGKLNVTGMISPLQVGQMTYIAPPLASLDDFDTLGNTYVRIDIDAAVSILAGIVGGAPGRIVHFDNIGTQPLNVSHQDTGSQASSRFSLPGGTTLVIAAGHAVTFIYDAVIQRWRLFSST